MKKKIFLSIVIFIIICIGKTKVLASNMLSTIDPTKCQRGIQIVSLGAGYYENYNDSMKENEDNQFTYFKKNMYEVKEDEYDEKWNRRNIVIL